MMTMIVHIDHVNTAHGCHERRAKCKCKAWPSYKVASPAWLRIERSLTMPGRTASYLIPWPADRQLPPRYLPWIRRRRGGMEGEWASIRRRLPLDVTGHLRKGNRRPSWEPSGDSRPKSQHGSEHTRTVCSAKRSQTMPGRTASYLIPWPADRLLPAQLQYPLAHTRASSTTT